MTELLPETWQYEILTKDQSGCCHQTQLMKKKAPITNLLLWLECYATLVSVLATKFPSYTPEFMAYQQTIIKAAGNFEGSAWATYDMCYRRKASRTRSLCWSQIDSALYHELFTGRARAIPRCTLCLSRNHMAPNCPLFPQQPFYHATAPHHSLPQTPQQTMLSMPGPQDPTVCGLFNKREGNQCRYKNCRYLHICRLCFDQFRSFQAHPALECHQRQANRQIGPPPFAPRAKQPRIRF